VTRGRDQAVFWQRQVALHIAAFVVASSLQAAPPVLDYIYPAGGQRGTNVELEAAGKFDPWPVFAWTDSPAIHVESGNALGKLVARIDKDAPVGVHLLRLFNVQGASALRCFVVGDQDEMREVEPNDELSNAQTVYKLPVTINGRLGKPGDIDRYAVTLQAGERLIASVQGRRLGSPMDPMLHLEDPRGIELAFAHDGLGLDPLLVYCATHSGTYIVRVSAFAFPPAADVKLTGGPADVYRLNLTIGPFVRGAIPSGVAHGSHASVRLFGWNLDNRNDHIDIGPIEPDAAEDHFFIPVSNGDNRLRIETGDVQEWTPEQLEAQGKAPAPPIAITGTLKRSNQRDAFTFVFKKNDRFHIAARPAALATALVPTVRVEDSDGKTIARSDEASLSVEAKLDWTAPADATYRVVIADLYRKGAVDYLYRLQIDHPVPRVRSSVDGHEYRVAPGKTVAIKLSVTRDDGYTLPLIAGVTGLPPGVTAIAAKIPQKTGDVVVTLTATSAAKVFSGPIHFFVATEGAPGHNIIATHNLRQDKDGPQELIDYTNSIWLTVLAPPASQATTRPVSRPASQSTTRSAMK
jgi:hypothetical protein